MGKDFWESYLESCDPKPTTVGDIACDILQLVSVGVIVLSIGVIACALVF